MGQMEMKCIFNIGKNISILAKVTQVRDVAHGPLVNILLLQKKELYTVLPLCVDIFCVCLSVTNFRHSFLSNCSS
jgi:hypothetical protein